MSYIGNQPTQVAFLTDQFNGTGSLTTFTMSVAPANSASIIVAVSGVVINPTAYSVSGTTLTFASAPASGTGNISVRYLGIPASGVATTAYRTVTEFTATAAQTTFTPPSYTAGFINVYRNGSRLATADYTATNGTTVVLTNAAVLNDTITVESFNVSSILNALPLSGGTISGNTIIQGLLTVGNGTVLGGATNPIVAMTKGANNYVQSYIINNTAGTSSSADFVAYPDNGTDAHGWVDVGVTSSTYADSTYTVTGPNEAYVFGSAPTGSGKTGNLVYATDNTGTQNAHQFYAGGFTQAKSAAKFTIDATGARGQLVSGTAVASTSGTSIDFTSIPSWVKRITVMFNGVSLSGSSNFLIQVGAGSVTTSGYTSAYSVARAASGLGGASTAGFIAVSAAAADTMSGSMTLLTLGSNVWVENHVLGDYTSQLTSQGGGNVTLGGTLDRVRITTVNGTDTFDAGSINIMYEG